MQIMASSSEEGVKPGLGWIPGKVKKIKSNFNGELLQSPHMGWNDAYASRSNPLLMPIGLPTEFYFLHSYYFFPDDKNNMLAEFNYGENMVCAISKDNIFGVQFHPEKSHDNGLKLLKKFSEV